MSRELEERVQLLEDRNAIVELWARYCELNDSQDVDGLLAEVYASDAVEEYTMGHQRGRIAGHEEIGRYFATELPTCEWTAHVLGQARVKVEGSSARGTHCITASHWLRRPDADPMRPADWIGVGTITDELRRDPAGWRVVHRSRRFTGGAIAVGTPPK